MLTAYDFPTGRACDMYGIDITLVGDSLAQVCLGYDSTTRLTLDEMIYHCRAVARGSKMPLLVADMPFGTYHTSIDDAVRNAVRLIREGGVEGIKLEGGSEILETVQKLTSLGIPVMAHVGLLPQRHTSLSGYKVQGKDARSASAIFRAALALEEAGAFSIVLEAIPYALGEMITRRCTVPTIGIGAGPRTSGQVLVWDDVMGTWPGHKAKFVRRFADIQKEAKGGVLGYASAVREGTFPDIQTESYGMDDGELKNLLQAEDERC
jgi:3-methyl-2-oxobutanoate hydroxymethyltransferase